MGRQVAPWLERERFHSPVFLLKSSSTSVLLEFAANAKIPDGADLGEIKGRFGVVKEQETNFRAYSPGGERGVVIGYRGLLLTQKGFLSLRTVAEPKWRAFLLADGSVARDALPEGAELVVAAEVG